MIIIAYYATALVTKVGEWGEAYSSIYAFPASFPSSVGESIYGSSTSPLLSSSLLATKFTAQLGFRVVRMCHIGRPVSGLLK